jgi:arsenite methyltransferase
MAQLSTEPVVVSSCCSAEAQSTCCEPSEKASCCEGTSASAAGGCGCAAGERAVAPAGVRETVRERYAAAARAAAEQPGSCCGSVVVSEGDVSGVFGAALYGAEAAGAPAGAVNASLGRRRYRAARPLPDS